MKGYRITKVVGITAGFATILVAIGFGILALLAEGLSKSWGSNQKPDEHTPSYMIIFLLILLLGVVTSIGTFGLRNKMWRFLYNSFSVVMGMGFVSMFFVTFGALGTKGELLLLSVGVVYLFLGYITYKRY
ncbi:multisubunit Na+/H+ antiporter MnhB subunit [Rossellomorea marisflavi]